MIPILLKERKMLSRHLNCYSDFILLDKIGFYNRLAAVRFGGEYRDWIKHFLRGIIFSAEKSINRINKLASLKEKNMKRIYASKADDENTIKLLAYAETNPIFNINMASEGIGLSYNTIAKAVKVLQDMSIIEQVNELLRNRCYAYKEYIDIVFGQGILIS